MGILRNLRNRGLKDILNPKRWVMFLRSKKVQVKSSIHGEAQALKDEYHEIFEDRRLLEQVVVRMTSNSCRPCLTGGECVHCGCKSPDLFFERDMECSGLSWFSMVDPDEWDEYKEGSGIIINEDYLRQVMEHGKIINF